MKSFSDYFGLWQAVREPTRKEYLLDLVLTDIQGTSTTVLGCISDHKAVSAKLPIAAVLEASVEREVWHLKAHLVRNCRKHFRPLIGNWMMDPLRKH